MSINKNNPIVIRPAILQELALVAELERQVFTSAVYPEFFFGKRMIYGQTFYYSLGKMINCSDICWLHQVNKVQ